MTPRVAEVDVVSDVGAAPWDSYVAGHPSASCYHQWCWRGLFEGVFRHETIYLAAKRGEHIAGVLPLVSFRSLMFGRFLVSLPFVNYGGVLADDEAAAWALVNAARNEAMCRGAASVELRHTRRMFSDLPARQHKVAMKLALPADAETAWKRFDNKLRNQIRKAEKSKLDAVTGGAELLGEFCSGEPAGVR